MYIVYPNQCILFFDIYVTDPIDAVVVVPYGAGIIDRKAGKNSHTICLVIIFGAGFKEKIIIAQFIFEFLRKNMFPLDLANIFLKADYIRRYAVNNADNVGFKVFLLIIYLFEQMSIESHNAKRAYFGRYRSVLFADVPMFS